MFKLIKRLVDFLWKLLGLPFYFVIEVIKWLRVSLIFIYQSISSILRKIIEYIFKFFNIVINTIKWIVKIIIKGIKQLPWLFKKIGLWLIEVIKESIAQIFTLLGFFIAWLTLTGSAKDIVGIAIILSTALWMVTLGLRKDS